MKMKQKETAGKRGTIFPMQSLPAPSRTVKGGKWIHYGKQESNGNHGRESGKDDMLKTANEMENSNRTHLDLHENFPPLTLGRNSAFHKASLSFCPSERMDNSHHEHTQPAGIPSTSDRLWADAFRRSAQSPHLSFMCPPRRGVDSPSWFSSLHSSLPALTLAMSFVVKLWALLT